MTVAAALLVKDEIDILAYTIRHLATQVDEILVTDNGSTDGTRELLAKLEEDGFVSRIFDDADPAYYQSRKVTWLADRARERGHDWFVPADADERWRSQDGRPIRDFLRSIAPDVLAVEAALFHYMPSSEDKRNEPDVFRRIGWRLAEPSPLPKVACRLVQGLTIDAGNHGCKIGGHRPRLVGGGLRVDHYSWRTADQYGRKIRNGSRAYAATDLPEGMGAHWRMWGDPEAPDLEARARQHFRRYFLARTPPCAPGSSDPSGLIYDPAEA